MNDKMESDEKQKTENKLISLEDIQDAVECIICLDIPKTDPVFQCTNGHVLCGYCHRRVLDCPICKIELGTIRALAIEKVLAKYPRDCKNDHFGCNVKLLKEEMKAHKSHVKEEQREKRKHKMPKHVKKRKEKATKGKK